MKNTMESRDYSKWFFEDYDRNDRFNKYFTDVVTLWFKDPEFLRSTIDSIDPNYSNFSEVKEIIAVIKSYVKTYGYELDIDAIINELNRKHQQYLGEETHLEIKNKILGNVVSEKREQYIKNNFPFLNSYCALAKGMNMVNELLYGGTFSQEEFVRRTTGICNHFNNILISLNGVENSDDEW